MTLSAHCSGMIISMNMRMMSRLYCSSSTTRILPFYLSILSSLVLSGYALVSSVVIPFKMVVLLFYGKNESNLVMVLVSGIEGELANLELSGMLKENCEPMPFFDLKPILPS